jgi:Tfp pilus assembly protein PilX
MRTPLARQEGVTLLISLIMLLLITMMTITSFKLTKGNLQIVGNMQQRSQALSAAQSAIEQTISKTQFTTTPANAIPNPCDGVPNRMCVDLNGDGVTDVKVGITPTCTSIQVVPVNLLNYSDANDTGCLVGANQDFGVVGAANNNSLCANMLWDVQANATDLASNAQVAVNQGVATRVAATAICP